MDDYAGRVLADRYRLPLPPSDEYELTETRAFDTYSGQEVLVRQVPLPEVVEAEVLDAEGLPDGFTARRPAARPGTRRPTDPAVRRAVEAAQAAARIPDHPRLDQVFDVFAEGGSLWIVSEVVAARSLATLMAEKPLTPYRAAEVASDVLMALRVLHAHGWVHRNITARTVLVCEDGRVMLTGLAVGAAEEALCGYDPVPVEDGAGGGAGGAHGPGGPVTPSDQGGVDASGPQGGPGARGGQGPQGGAGGGLVGPGSPGGLVAQSGVGGVDPVAARSAAIRARTAGGLPGVDADTANGSGGSGTFAPKALESGGDIRAARAGAIAAYRAGARAAARVQEAQNGRAALPGARPTQENGPAALTNGSAQPYPPGGGLEAARPGDAGQSYLGDGPAALANGAQPYPPGGGLEAARPGDAGQSYASGGEEADAGRSGGAGQRYPADGGVGAAHPNGAVQPYPADSGVPAPRPDGTAPPYASGEGVESVPGTTTPPGRIADPYGVGGTSWHGATPRGGTGAGVSHPGDRRSGEVTPPGLPRSAGDTATPGAPAPGLGTAPPAGLPNAPGFGMATPSTPDTSSPTHPYPGAPAPGANARVTPYSGAPASAPDTSSSAHPYPGAPAPGAPASATPYPGAPAPAQDASSASPYPGAGAPAHPSLSGAPARSGVPNAPAHPGAGVGAPATPQPPTRWTDLVAGTPGPPRGPATALAAERARQARMAVVGPVTERWAPEQAGPVHENWQLAAPIGPATDLWALGALLFRAVQGHAPYPEESTAELVQMVCAEPPAFAEECGPLRPVVESLLRQDPTERLDFEELRGWLRSLVRSAPEPEAGTHVVAAPPADPSRLPIVRRRGELVRRRRAGLPATTAHGRHKRAKEQAGSPRRLGRTLLLLILLLLAGAVAYAMLFMPKAGQDGASGGSERTGADGAVSPAPVQSGKGSTGGRPSQGQSSPGSTGTPSASASAGATETQTTDPDVAAGFTVRKDPEGFQVAVAKGWTRTGKNAWNQVVYSKGDYELIIVAGRDGAVTYGSDPMAYQRDEEHELQPYRSSSWATATGLRTITVGTRVMAEGQFTWTDGDGRDLYVRNLAILINGRYHVVQVRGPESQRDEVTKLYDQASSTYAYTG
ncbi:protein kinase [Streptomyces sp. NPDC005648]|uniref:protein kinase n=1 Tax=Streptomyces sp. NPDC005648 TaxID=3157044 RepID=UPI0033B75BB8